MAGFGRGRFGRDVFGGSEESKDSKGLDESLSVSDTLGVGDSIWLTDAVGLSADLDLQEDVILDESVSIVDLVFTGTFSIQNVAGRAVRVTFPMQLHYEGIGNAENFGFEPDLDLSTPSAPVSIVGLESMVEVLQQGSQGAVVPELLEDGGYDFSVSTSTHFRLTGSLDPNVNVGDFLNIKTGQNLGTYQILKVLASEGPQVVVALDRPMVLLDGCSGVQSIQSSVGISNLENAAEVAVDFQLVAVSGDFYTFQAKHPAITPSNPICGLYRLSRLSRAGSILPALNGGGVEGVLVADELFSLAGVTLVDYRTVQIQDGGAPPLRGTLQSTIVDRFSAVLQLASSIEWEHTTGVLGLEVTTTKLKNGGAYTFSASGIYRKWPKTLTSFSASLRAQGVPLPRVVEASVSPEGYVTVVYDEAMQQDSDNLGNPGDYVITGPTSATVQRVHWVDERRVVLVTQGLGDGQYMLTVSSNTPEDVAGNPIDPAFDQVSFVATTPVMSRSLFTNKGPIAKPPLTLQSGTAAEFRTFERIFLPGGVFTLGDIGRRLRVVGSSDNDGSYDVLAIVGSSDLKVSARFALPDGNDGAVDWELVDPRTGEIADDPADVVVRVEGGLVVPTAVIGLMGQVVLPSETMLMGDVQIDYSWVSNPRVAVQRLNSLEFRLNAWNRDPGGPSQSHHHYRYNNILVTPSEYDGSGLADSQPQPLMRGLKYRACERAYTPVFNDPTKLVFNTPIHRIAYLSASRQVFERVALYDAQTLPEADSVNPWVRRGIGNAVATAGSLVVIDDSAATFPTGEPLFWTQTIDVSFDHVVSVAWRFAIDAVTVSEGVWTGLAAGYSNARSVYAVGYIEDAGVKKIGFLKRGAEDAFASSGTWGGGQAAIPFDWSVPHSYRLFTDRQGITHLYVDGDVVETLRIGPDEAPSLAELNGAFREIQGVFFGSLSRPARTTSTWQFYHYLIQPVSIVQLSPSSFVSYEGNDLPEVDSAPWTPVGFHGTSAVFGESMLLVDSTSATDAATSAAAGLVGGDFRGYVKIEPLLSAASQFAVDARLQLLTHTHGIDPDGLMVAVDDGTRLLQLSFFPTEAAPKLSYGGRSLPEEFSPFVWASMGTQPAAMRGRLLRLSDGVTSDGRVYSINDSSPVGTATRVLSAATDYILEFRCTVISHATDDQGFAGAFATAYDGSRLVGLLLQDVAGTSYVALHSDGVTLGASARFAFEWDDGRPHTYRIRKSTGGNLVSVFVDGMLLGSFAYSGFAVPPPVAPPSVVGQVSFGSSTPASAQAMSVVDWHYCNAWRVAPSVRRYAGLWKGVDRDSLTGYHLPLKASGGAAAVAGNTLTDSLANFTAANVQSGDALVVDTDPNRGVYAVASVVSATVLTITGVWPGQSSVSGYRIPRETDWSVQHTYRLARDSTGMVSVYLDEATVPMISVDYDAVDLPGTGAGVLQPLSSGLAAIAFGSFSADNLEQSLWDFVRYGITRSQTELGIVPPHQVLNQWNVMESPERLSTQIPHERTSFKSSSTGTTSQVAPDFLAREEVSAHTQLNQGTPIVPLTQTFANRGPFVTQTPVALFSESEDVLGGPFVISNGATRFAFTVPEDVLYTSLQLVETAAGEADHLAPFGDEPNPGLGGVNYRGEVCLAYTGELLPEADLVAGTPWTLISDDPSQVEVSAADGVLTYGTGDAGTKTAYFNNTPLLNTPSLRTEVTFRIRVAHDATLGTGDSQVRFGLSAPGMTVGIGFVTHPGGERFAEVFDIKDGSVMGRAAVNYLDGEYHGYRIVRDPGAGVVEVYVDQSGIR